MIPFVFQQICFHKAIFRAVPMAVFLWRYFTSTDEISHTIDRFGLFFFFSHATLYQCQPNSPQYPTAKPNISLIVKKHRYSTGHVYTLVRETSSNVAR